MANNDYIEQLSEKILKREELTPEEKDFILSNKILTDSYPILSIVKEIIISERNSELNPILEEIFSNDPDLAINHDKSNQNNPKFRKSNKKKRYYAVGSVVMILFLTIIVAAILLNKNTFQNQDVFAEYLNHYPNVIINRGQTDSEKILSIAFEKYELRTHEGYENSIIYFENYLNKEPQDLTIKFYLANSYLHIKNFDNAIALYSEILKENQSDFRFNDKLYLNITLAYICSGKKENAKFILQDINTGPNSDLYRLKKDILNK